MRLLIIEDDKLLANTLKDKLRQSYAVDIALSGKDGLYQAQVTHYDIISLDIVLPDIDGVDLCCKLRASGVKTPILMLTGSEAIAEKVKALDAGADDYLTKPFSFDELTARLRALLRRSPEVFEPLELRVNDLVIDIKRRTVTREGQTIALRRKEFDLLEYLARNTGRVLSRGMILEHVWNNDAELYTNTIDVHIKNLRDRIDRDFRQKLIKTVHGLGYKLEDKHASLTSR